MKGARCEQRYWRLTFLVLFLTWSIWVVAVSAAAAHSVLERSDPPADATLDAQARSVRLSFTEPIDPAFSMVTVLVPQGTQISQGIMVSEDRRRITVPLAAHGRGAYTVKWRVLSALDSHITSGVFVFAVGQPPPLGLGNARVEARGVRLITIRWFSFLAGLVLVGSTLFPLAALRPGLPAMDAHDVAVMRAALSQRLRSLQIASGLVLLIGVAIELGLTASTLFDVPFAMILARGLMWPLLVGTRIGWSVLIRASLAALLLLPATRRGQIIQSIGLMMSIGVAGLAVLFKSPAALANPSHIGHLTLIVVVSSMYGLVNAIRRQPVVNWMPLLAAGGILAGMTLTAHASGRGGLAVVADWMHLVAAAIWVGGLASLFVALGTAKSPDRTRLVQVVVPQFSTAAALSFGVLLVTGGYSAWLHVPGLRALVVTGYGQVLVIKLVFVLLLVVLGAFNHYVMRPRLQTLPGPTTLAERRFRAAVGAEVVLAAALLVATAVLTHVPPAR